MLNNNTKTVLLHVTVVVTCLLQLQYLIICLDATVYAELISYIYLNNLTTDRLCFNKNNNKFNEYTIFNKKI